MVGIFCGLEEGTVTIKKTEKTYFIWAAGLEDEEELDYDKFILGLHKAMDKESYGPVEAALIILGSYASLSRMGIYNITVEVEEDEAKVTVEYETLEQGTMTITWEGPRRIWTRIMFVCNFPERKKSVSVPM